MAGAGDKPEGGDQIPDQPMGVVPPPTPEELQRMLQQQFNAVWIEVLSVLSAFAPHLSEQEAKQLAQRVAAEQMDQKAIPLIIRSMIDRDAASKHPTLHLFVQDAKGLKVDMKAPKRLEEIKDLTTAAQSAVLLAFLLAPGARAVLRAFGFHYTLAQSQTPAGGRVILSS